MAVRLLAGAAAIALVGSLATIPTAHADTNDAKFISTLQSEGITEHFPATYAIEAAHVVCQNLDSGKSPKEEASEMVGTGGMTAYHAGYFVGASIEDYCPQHMSDLNGKKPS